MFHCSSQNTKKIVIGFCDHLAKKEENVINLMSDNQGINMANSWEIISQLLGQILLNDKPIFENACKIRDYIIIIRSNNETGELYSNLSEVIKTFSNKFTELIQEIKDVDALKNLWMTESEKINVVTPLLSGVHGNGLPLENLFSHIVTTTLHQNEDVKARITDIILDLYSSSSFSEHSSFDFAYHFAKKFDLQLGEKLFFSLINHMIEPIEKAFDLKINEYMDIAINLKKKEIDAISSYMDHTDIRSAEAYINKLIFLDKYLKDGKFTSIISDGLLIIIENDDKDCLKVLVDLARDTDKIELFVKELSRTIEHSVEETFKQPETAIQKCLKLYRTMTLFHQYVKFSEDDMNILKRSFNIGFNADEEVTQYLTNEIDNLFTTKNCISDDEMNDLISLFKMLDNKDEFTDYHLTLLRGRVFKMKRHTVETDYKFVNLLESVCGPNYVKVFRDILDSLSMCLDDMTELRKSETTIPYWFSITAYYSESWSGLELPDQYKVPMQIKPYIEAYKKFFGKKTFSFILDLTKVVLKVRNIKGLNTVKCSGTYAALLCVFNISHRLSKSFISDVTGIPIETIENMLQILSSESCCQLLSVTRSHVIMSRNVPATKGLLSLPVVFPAVTKGRVKKKKNPINRVFQIEAAIALLMKHNKTLSRDVLLEKVRDYVERRVADDAFEEAMKKLQRNEIIKVDQSTGNVYYN